MAKNSNTESNPDRPNEDILIGTVEKGPTQAIRVNLTVFNGKEMLDIRQHYKADDGSWKPTQKGVTLDREIMTDLLGLIENAIAVDDDSELWKNHLKKLASGEIR